MEANTDSAAHLVVLLDTLRTAAEAKPPRSQHLLADLALDMLSCQLYAHCYAVSKLARSDIPEAAYPSARACFETAEDMVVLGWAPTMEEYDRLGAQAYVTGEVATVKVSGRASGAVAVLGRHDLKKAAMPLKQAVELGVQRWQTTRSDANQIVEDALATVRDAWNRGTKHWSGKPRNEVHHIVAQRLGDATVKTIAESWYGYLSHRSHPGLHWPPLSDDNGTLQFHISGHQLNVDPIPVATATWAAEVGTRVLQDINAAR